MTDDALGTLAARLRPAVAPRLPWHDDAARFAREAVSWPSGEEPADYQAAALEALVSGQRLAVRSPRGAGKTTLVALAILWFAITRDHAGEDWKAPVISASWRQVERFVWPELVKWSRRVRWDLVGRPPFDPRTELTGHLLKLRHGHAFGASTDDPGLLEGAHADHVLVVLDEAKSVPAPVFDSIEGTLAGAGGEMLALVTSTPGPPSGRFAEIFQRRPGLEEWATLRVTLAEAVEAGRVSAQWAEQRRAQWGADSALYLSHVEGDFAEADDEGVIPLAWVEAATERWRAWEDQGRPIAENAMRVVGVDVARGGKDKTVIALRLGDVVESLERFSHADTMTTTGYVVGQLQGRDASAVVDVIGVGAGVVDRLKEQRYRVVAFNASEKATGRDRSGGLGFLNRRAQAWWHLRELLDPATDSEVCLPPDDELLGDLVAPRWTVTSAGKVQIESKDELRRRLGRSTDCGDAVVMSFWEVPRRRRGRLVAAGRLPPATS